MKPKPHIPTEDQEQMALMEWARLNALKHEEFSLLYAIPNGMIGDRHVGYKLKMRKMGLKSGVPDLCLPIARQGFHSLYIEMKRKRGGRLSPEQKVWIACLKQEGHRVEVCKGWAEASWMIADYLNMSNYRRHGVTEEGE